jgi:voltage-gated potassium channel
MSKIMFKIIHFLKLIGNLLISVPFLTISILGNGIVFVFATIMYFIECDVNPKMTTFLDALWWSFSTTTTVGYGDITPITIPGKIIGILLMLIGVAVFGIYTAIFARAIIDDDIYME